MTNDIPCVKYNPVYQMVSQRYLSLYAGIKKMIEEGKLVDADTIVHRWGEIFNKGFDNGANVSLIQREEACVSLAFDLVLRLWEVAVRMDQRKINRQFDFSSFVRVCDELIIKKGRAYYALWMEQKTKK